MLDQTNSSLNQIRCNRRKKYERTKKGFVMRQYCNLRCRVHGLNKKPSPLFEGQDLAPKEEFYKWALLDKAFNDLFDHYEANGRPRELAPAIDRHDTDRGFVLGNIKWVTHKDNYKYRKIRQSKSSL